MLLRILNSTSFFKKIQYLTAGEPSVHQLLKKEFDKNQPVPYSKDMEAF